MTKRSVLLITLLAGAWISVHAPAIIYGTAHSPLHISYWSADEQSPVNGALHVLQERTLLGMRNETTLHYGPVFALLAIPPILLDAGLEYIVQGSFSAELYKRHIVWHWGTVLQGARLQAVLAAFLGLVAVFLMFRTRVINPQGLVWVPYLAATALGGTYFYFELMSFFRHWTFVVCLLLWQLCILMYQLERRTNLWLWVAQGILTVLAFGISYLSILYQVFWLPVIFMWIRDKDYRALRALVIFGFVTLAGCALVVWWHPYGFFRVLTQVGLADSAPINSVLALDTATSSHSFLFYIWLTVLHVGVLIAGALFAAGIRLWTFILQPWTWALLLPAVVNVAVFGIPAHHEARYVLPSIVLLVLWSLALYTHSYTRPLVWFSRRWIAAVLLIIWFSLNMLQIIGWSRMMAAGPVERSDIIPQILAWQEADPETRTLVIKGWPLGWAHTQEAYKDYVRRYNKSGYELWQYLVANEPPSDSVPLNVYYLHEGEELTDIVMSRYEHVVRHWLPPVGEDLAAESPQDEFDIRPWNVWRYREYQERYEIIK